MRGITRAILCGLALLAAVFPERARGDTYVLSTDNIFPRSTPAYNGFEDLIIREMFRRIGHEAKILHIPSERSLAIANEGIGDGDFVRIAGLEAMYPNLVMVPEKICDFEFAAFSKNPAIVIRDWASLNPYNVGIIIGWKILEANLTGARSLAKVKDVEALFDLLVHDRADLVVYDRIQGMALVQRKRIAGLTPLEPLLAKRDMHLYLNRRHAPIVPELARALRDMKRDGTWQRMIDTVLVDLERQ